MHYPVTILIIFFLLHPSLLSAAPPVTSDLATLLREGKEGEIVARAEGTQLSGDGAFIAGIAAFRQRRFDLAAKHLEKASRSSIPVRDYALLFLARSLGEMKEYSASLAAYETLIATFPDSRLIRHALFERGETLFAAGRYQEAASAIETAIKRFPTGSDALKGTLTQARARIEAKEIDPAIRQLQMLTVTSPASPESRDAAAILDRLASRGVTIPPLSDEDRFKRGVTLAETGYPDRGVEELETLASRESQTFRRKVRLRIGEILFRAKRYQKAHDTFATLLQEEVAPDPLFWSGRSLARLGAPDDAVERFREVVRRFPRSDRADDALYHEALLWNDKKEGEKVRTILSTLIREYPSSPLLSAARWEIALSAIMDGLPEIAHPHLIRLQDDDRYRERAIYWLSVVAERRSESPLPFRNRLATDYPFGFYSTHLRQEGKLPPLDLPPVEQALERLLPEPAGFEREQFLMACGMTADTIAELRLREKQERSPSKRQQIARLYLTLKRFDGLYRQGKELVDKRSPSPLSLALFYPPAYFDDIKRLSSRYRVPAALLLSLVRAESGYDPAARSPAGAIGLTQLLPSTARGMEKGVGSESLTDPTLNLSLGSRHLRDLLTRYQGDPLLALAAYNAGSSVVDRWAAAGKGYDRVIFIESIPYRETREYVKKIIAATAVYVRLYPDLATDAPLVGSFFMKSEPSS